MPFRKIKKDMQTSIHQFGQNMTLKPKGLFFLTLLRIFGLLLFTIGILDTLQHGQISLFSKLLSIWAGLAIILLSMIMTQNSSLPLVYRYSIRCVETLFLLVNMILLFRHALLLSSLASSSLVDIFKVILIWTGVLFLLLLSFAPFWSYENKLTFFSLFIFSPFCLVALLSPPRKLRHNLLIAIGATAMLVSIIISLYLGDILVSFLPIHINSHFIMMLLAIFILDKTAQFCLPKTSLVKAHMLPETIKYCMFWGIILTMIIFYLFDWTSLLGGTDGWSLETRNTVLWAFTIYRLIYSIKDLAPKLFD